jgi:hypothetical protein
VTEVALTALEGTNPLGFLAALGTLDALTDAVPHATLRWTEDLVPHAIVGGVKELDGLLAILLADREVWVDSSVLAFPSASPLADAKPKAVVLRQWFQAVADLPERREADLLCSLVAEGAFDGSGRNAKPTHLHFTAGRQQFLEMVRILSSEVDREHLREALLGPWLYSSKLPSLSWDAGSERIYAVRGTNPSDEKRLGVPGADWLAFRGLVFYPVRTLGESLRTTACDDDWKRGAFRWPLWAAPITRDVAWSLVADPTLVSRRAHLPSAAVLRERGITFVLQAPIKRNDQGGYGSFGAPEILASAVPSSKHAEQEMP